MCCQLDTLLQCVPRAAAPLCCCPCAQELDACSQAVGSAAARVASLQVLEAVVSEFSLVTASQLGLSWEFHVTCRNQLEVRQPLAAATLQQRGSMLHAMLHAAVRPQQQGW